MSASVDPEPRFLRLAIALATENVRGGHGGPFGAVIVRGGEVIAQAANTVTATNDPTAHAEVNAIRAACKALGTFQLPECDLYSSCEPCPMCLAAAHWARCRAIYFGSRARDAADAGFDDEALYREMCLPVDQRSMPMKQITSEDTTLPFAEWRRSSRRVDY